MTTMTSGFRKFVLTAHVSSSVGWIGAVAAFLALALAGLSSQDALRVRAAYIAMDLTAWSVILPLSLATLLTGLVLSLGTPWGLFRHYWVVVKLFIAILATVILLLHMRPIGQLAETAAESVLSSGDQRGIRIQLVANAVAAIFVLLVAVVLSVYKPEGLTPYGWRKFQRQRAGLPAEAAPAAPRWVKAFGYIVISLALIFLIKHLIGGGMGAHGH